ncbi:hypothetical protein D0469_16690, partial [Peribacillus saganii]
MLQRWKIINWCPRNKGSNDFICNQSQLHGRILWLRMADGTAQKVSIYLMKNKLHPEDRATEDLNGLLFLIVRPAWVQSIGCESR